MSEAQLALLVSSALTIAAIFISSFGFEAGEKKIKNATIVTLLALILLYFALTVLLINRDSEPNKSPRYEKLENVYQLKE